MNKKADPYKEADLKLREAAKQICEDSIDPKTGKVDTELAISRLCLWMEKHLDVATTAIAKNICDEGLQRARALAEEIFRAVSEGRKVSAKDLDDAMIPLGGGKWKNLKDATLPDLEAYQRVKQMEEIEARRN